MKALGIGVALAVIAYSGIVIYFSPQRWEDKLRRPDFRKS